MFRVFHFVTVGRRQRQKEGKERDQRRWIALPVVVSQERNHCLMFHSFLCLFLSVLTFIANESSMWPPPFPFSVCLSFDLISHPRFWQQRVISYLLPFFPISCSHPHISSWVAAHLFTWLRHGNTNFPVGHMHTFYFFTSLHPIALNYI